MTKTTKKPRRRPKAKRHDTVLGLLRESHDWIGACAPMAWCAHGADPRVFEDAACHEKRGADLAARIDELLKGKGTK